MTDGPTWTIPTLVGTTLYVRDQKILRAFDLGQSENPEKESLTRFR